MKTRLAAILLIIATGIILIVECCKTDKASSKEALTNAYTGNVSCKSCHQTEHQQWTTSHHYMAMLPANDSTVVGNFDNASFSADGVTSHFFKKDGKFYINTEGDDGKNHDYEVKFTFGFTPLQQYLIAFPGGKMQATRLSWDTRSKKWFHQYAGQKMPAGDWLHWTGNGQNWNTMCATCHSTNLQKGYNVETDTYNTTYNEINVSCESCHGPGKNHIDYINSDDYKEGKKTGGSLLRLYAGEGQVAQVNACGYCHARRVDLTGNVLPGAEMLDDLVPELPTTEFFFADGQMNDEDYNYTSFLQSKMYHRGVQCSNCHNPHSGKLKLQGPLVCGQCHDSKKYEAPTHTLHSNTIADVNCISCHMPSKIYMGNDLRHDHSFRIPRPDLTAKFGTPNTCNSCHKNKTAQWAAEAIAKAFGNTRRYHFAEDLIPGSQLNANSEAHLNKLLADTATPQIVRAATINYLSRLPQNSAAQTLVKQLQDASPMVRNAALHGLTGQPVTLWAQAAAPLLQDKVRAVRIAAAELFTNVSANQIPGQYYEAFTKAKAELERFILYQTDFATGNLQAGDYFRKQNDLGSAEKFYIRAIAKDSQLAIARINLASTLNATGKNPEALKQLLIAAALEPGSDHVYYTLGLLYAEMKDLPKAEKALQKAIQLNPGNVKATYNYGLLLQQIGKIPQAEIVYKNGLKQDGSNGEILNALTILYLQQQQTNKAMATGRLLQQYHGNNPQYGQLLAQLGLQ